MMGQGRGSSHTCPASGVPGGELCTVEPICLLGNVFSSGRFWKVPGGSMWAGPWGARALL